MVTPLTPMAGFTFPLFFNVLKSISLAGLACAGQSEKAPRLNRISCWIFPVLFLWAVIDSFFLTGDP